MAAAPEYSITIGVTTEKRGKFLFVTTEARYFLLCDVREGLYLFGAIAGAGLRAQNVTFDKYEAEISVRLTMYFLNGKARFFKENLVHVQHMSNTEHHGSHVWMHTILLHVV